jgi:uncharacterized cupredoxin-like copper-binding protein
MLRNVAIGSSVLLATAVLASPMVLAQESPAPGESPAVVSPSAAVSSAAPASAGPTGTPVGVTLVEFTVTPDTTSIPAGSVTLSAENISTEFEHELVVVRTDLAADALPTHEDGSFDEDAEGVEVLGEIEEFAPGTSESLTLDLAAGHYVFLCNVVVDIDGAPLSHYQQGMRVDVDVVGSGTAVASGAPAASAAPMASAAPVASGEPTTSDPYASPAA